MDRDSKLCRYVFPDLSNLKFVKRTGFSRSFVSSKLRASSDLWKVLTEPEPSQLCADIQVYKIHRRRDTTTPEHDVPACHL